MGRKNHQPLDKSRRWNLSQFKGLGGVTVNKMELAAIASGLLALSAVGDHDRNTLRLRLDPQRDATAFEPGMTVWIGR